MVLRMNAHDLDDRGIHVQVGAQMNDVFLLDDGWATAPADLALRTVRQDEGRLGTGGLGHNPSSTLPQNRGEHPRHARLTPGSGNRDQEGNRSPAALQTGSLEDEIGEPHRHQDHQENQRHGHTQGTSRDAPGVRCRIPCAPRGCKSRWLIDGRRSCSSKSVAELPASVALSNVQPVPLQTINPVVLCGYPPGAAGWRWSPR